MGLGVVGASERVGEGDGRGDTVGDSDVVGAGVGQMSSHSAIWPSSVTDK